MAALGLTCGRHKSPWTPAPKHGLSMWGYQPGCGKSLDGLWCCAAVPSDTWPEIISVLKLGNVSLDASVCPSRGAASAGVEVGAARANRLGCREWRRRSALVLTACSTRGMKTGAAPLIRPGTAGIRCRRAPSHV
jgi:hypothetical protein